MEVFVNVILFIAGLVFGNWLAIGRDKRKEFNDVADKVYLALKKQKERVKESDAVISGPDDDDLERLKRILSIFKKKRFVKCINRYRAVTSSDNWKRDQVGQAFYKDSEIVLQAIDELIQHTSRK